MRIQNNCPKQQILPGSLPQSGMLPMSLSLPANLPMNFLSQYSQQGQNLGLSQCPKTPTATNTCVLSEILKQSALYSLLKAANQPKSVEIPNFGNGIDRNCGLSKSINLNDLLMLSNGPFVSQIF